MFEDHLITDTNEISVTTLQMPINETNYVCMYVHIIPAFALTNRRGRKKHADLSCRSVLQNLTYKVPINVTSISSLVMLLYYK